MNTELTKCMGSASCLLITSLARWPESSSGGGVVPSLNYAACFTERSAPLAALALRTSPEYSRDGKYRDAWNYHSQRPEL